MAVGLVMNFKGLGAARYDAVMRELGLTATGQEHRRVLAVLAYLQG